MPATAESERTVASAILARSGVSVEAFRGQRWFVSAIRTLGTAGGFSTLAGAFPRERHRRPGASNASGREWQPEPAIQTRTGLAHPPLTRRRKADEGRTAS